MQILKASYAYVMHIYYLHIKHRRDHADSSCSIAFFCTGKTEMPFEFEKYIHTTRYCALHTMTHTYVLISAE